MRIKSPIGAALAFALLASAAHAQYPYPSPQDSAPPPPPPPGADAQGQAPAPTPIYAPEQLDQMLASIALYPDPLLTDILTASTYPLEVVEAARWLQAPQNARINGGALEASLDSQNWDPSVKSLVPFPPIVRLMDAHLDWTQSLGNAFLAQPADVMDSVQRLRHDAQAAGTLTSNAQQVVNVDGPYIGIEPANPQTVYVPVYAPQRVYGAWPYPGYPPIYYGPPPGYSVGVVEAGIGFGVGLAVVGALWNWGDWDWYDHRVQVDPNRFNHINAGRPPVSTTTWQHNPEHRGGAPYRDATSRARFEQPVPGAPAQRQGYRFYGDQASRQPQQQQQHAAVTPQRSEATPAPAAAPQHQRNEPPQRRNEGQPARGEPQPQRNPATQARPGLPPAPAPAAALPPTPRPTAALPQTARPAPPQRPTPPTVAAVPPPRAERPPSAFQSSSRGPDAQAHAQRGEESRHSAPAPAVVAHAAPPPPRAAPPPPVHAAAAPAHPAPPAPPHAAPPAPAAHPAPAHAPPPHGAPPPEEHHP